MRLLFCAAVAIGCTFGAQWKGTISESGCGLKHAEASAGAEKCVTACVRKGAAPVLVSEGKVIRLGNADKVMDHLGKSVVITGKLEEDVLKIESVKAE